MCPATWVRAPLSPKKLVYLDGQKAVLYRSRMNPFLGRDFEAMDPLEWLARVADHIPDTGKHRTHFYTAAKPLDDPIVGDRLTDHGARTRIGSGLDAVGILPTTVPSLSETLTTVSSRAAPAPISDATSAGAHGERSARNPRRGSRARHRCRGRSGR